MSSAIAYMSMFLSGQSLMHGRHLSPKAARRRCDPSWFLKASYEELIDIVGNVFPPVRGLYPLATGIVEVWVGGNRILIEAKGGNPTTPFAVDILPRVLRIYISRNTAGRP